jgi:excisionase family DNA binding protein
VKNTNPPAKNGKILSVPQAARRLEISSRAFWNRIYRGQVPYHRWGRKVIIFEDELEEFLSGLPGVGPEEASARAEL